MQSRCNVIHDVGFLEFGTTSSLEMLTMANELVGMSGFFTKGIPVDRQTLALDVIESVAERQKNPIFLTENHTIEHFMRAQFLPKLLDRSQYELWEETGGLNLYDRCNAEAKRILSEHRVEPKPKELLSEIDQMLQPSGKAMAV
jgi:trimethylamine--corrinoid protein Co-methyltransferase